MLAYDFKVWYLFDNIQGSNISVDTFFSQYWAISIASSVYQLFYAMLLDKYISLSIYNNAFNSDWFRIMLHSKESSLIWLYHPELVWHIDIINNFFSYFYSSSLKFAYSDKNNSDICILAHTLYAHILVLLLIFSAFVTVLFNFYGNPNTEENTIDSDYLSASGTVEAEKEITSIDDYLGLVFTISYVFGVFFYIHAWTSIVSNSPLMMSYYSIFMMFIFVLGMPTLMLYDLGIFFLTYLKGAGKNSNSSIEVIFDYIACIVFYTRILAQ